MNRPAADLPDGLLEAQLRAAFAEATADLAATPNPWARTARAVARSRVRRRAGGLAAVAVAAVVALVAVVHPPARREAQPARPAVTAADVSTWPTRGNLAGRADLVAAVSAKAADGGKWRVVAMPYLGTIDEMTAALAIVEDAAGAHGAARHVVVLYGRQSVPVDRWRSRDGDLPTGPVPVLTATFFDGGEWSRGIAVTLSQGVRVAWSPRPFVDRSGQTVRSFIPLALDDGVGTWRTRWKAGLVTVRADWAGHRTVLKPQIQAVEEEAAPAGALLPDLAPACAKDPSYLDLAYSSGLTEAWNESAVRKSSVTKVRLVWCGHVGAEQVVLTGVTSRDGTDFQMLTERLTNRASQDTTVQVWPVPPGRAADYPMARELLSDPLYVDQPSALAVIAPGAVTAELQQGDPTVVVGLRKLTGDGFAHIRLTPAELHQWRSDKPADLVVRDVHGQERDRVRVGVNDPWGEEIDGADATTDAPPTR